MSTMKNEICKEYVGGRERGDFLRDCGRPAKQDGLCGMHLAARDKRRANDEKRRLERLESKAAEERVMARLSELGITGRAHYNGGYQDFAVISLEELAKLVRDPESHVEGNDHG